MSNKTADITAIKQQTYLCLHIVTSTDRAHGPEGGCNDFVLGVYQQFHQSPTHSHVYHCLDLLIWTVTEIGVSYINEI